MYKRLVLLALIVSLSFAGQIFASGGPTVGVSKDEKNSVSKERSLS